MTLEFPNEETRNQVLTFGAVEGGNQTLSRLESYLQKERINR